VTTGIKGKVWQLRRPRETGRTSQRTSTGQSATCAGLVTERSADAGTAEEVTVRGSMYCEVRNW